MLALFQSTIIILQILSLLYIVSFYLIIKKDDEQKLSSYESGFEPLGNARIQIWMLHYLIGILYLIFDLEIIFIFPYAAIINQTNNLIALWSIMLFQIILTLGFIYEYQKGAQELKEAI